MTTTVYSDKVIIRKYESRDRQAVRRLCCNTAYFGEPCETFFPDRRLLADLVMNYFTDYEDQHIWIAEHEAEVVGYIAACFEETRHKRIMLFKIVPISLIRALIRGKIWSIKTYKLIAYSLKSFFLKETNLAKLDYKRFPVHIHQNIKKGFRGKGIGSRLLIALLNEVKENNLSGIRFKALRQEPEFLFFEKYGFKKYDCKRVKSWETWLRKAPLYLMAYGKEYL